MRRFIRRLTRNWKLKLLACALAVLLWVVVSADQVTSNWIPVPVQVRVNDPGYRLLDRSVPDEVQVRFTGPGRDFVDLAIRGAPLILTIDEVQDTVELFALDPRMVRVPTQLSVVPQDVDPERVLLRFTRLRNVSVPVRLRIRDELGRDWAVVDSLSIDPPEVLVTGPPERVRGLREIRTEEIVLREGDSAFVRSVALDTSGLRDVRVSTRRVTVRGEIDRLVTREYPDVPISIGPGVIVEPERVDTRISGAERVVGTLAATGFRVVVAIDSIPSQLPEDGVTVPLRVEGLPSGLNGTAEPSSVRLFPAAAVEPPDTAAAAVDTARVGERRG